MTNTQISEDILAPVQQEGTKAVLRTWLKTSGQSVKKDEPVVELETDKVVVEVSAPCDGILETILGEGADAAPGALLGRVSRGTAQPVAAASQTDTQPGSTAKDTDREQAAEFDPEMRLSPSVRRLLAEHSLNPADLAGIGTGRGGRLTREDVVAVIEAQTNAPQASVAVVPAKEEPSAKAAPATPAPTPQVSAAPVVSQAANGPRVAAHVPHSTMRRKIAEHMQHSVTVAPHVTSVFEVDFGAIMAHRKKHKKDYEKEGINLTFTAYFIAAAVEAMRVAPEVNSRWYDDYLQVFKDINIGVGTALGDKGLIVPVIKEAQDLSLRGIASRLQGLTEAARIGKLKPCDVQGGTFTISNHGVSGSLFASPIIINQPQSAILGIGALEKRVVVKEIDGVDTIQVRPRAYVSLTIDHRVLDGSQTNLWLSRFVEVLETWKLND